MAFVRFIDAIADGQAPWAVLTVPSRASALISSTPPPDEFRHLDSLRIPTDRFGRTCITCPPGRSNARSVDPYLTIPWATSAQDDFTSPQNLTDRIAQGEVLLNRTVSAARLREPSPNGRDRRRHHRLPILRRVYEQ